MAEKSKVVTVLGHKDRIVSGERGWRNPARAKRVIRFIEALTIPSGVGAGRPFKLRPFQKRFIQDVYEPCDASGLRIVRDAVLSMGRKNGKTALIAALALVHLIGPEAVHNGEVYSAANDKDQAAIIFKFAAQLVRLEPLLDAAEGGPCKVIDSAKRVVVQRTGSFYRALSREAGTKHGLNPTFAIYDELAQSKDRELYDTINTAFGAREEPLFVVISTQSRDPQHILSEIIDRGISDENPSVVCHLYAVPDEADPWDESVWKLANPALGDFLTLKSLRDLAKQAQDSPSFEPSFRNLHLNQRVDSKASLITRVAWEGCYVPEEGLKDGERVYFGLDLSSTNDLTAMVGVSERGAVGAWFWKPEDTIREHETRDRVPYERWVREGYIDAIPGPVIDLEYVASAIDAVSQRYDVAGIHYDPWRVQDLLIIFEKLGIRTYDEQTPNGDGVLFIPCGQNFKGMAPAIDAMERAILSKAITHGGNPVLTWCLSNAIAVSDAAGNRKLDKSKARFRIDGAVSLAMAMGLRARFMPAKPIDLNPFLNDPVIA